ncbi:MAG: PD-(D/E)XK nuclease family protein [Patescibacteria group bacterium]|nr:PD-(D/E)XK nuclease family protein [Patescibacteria group bacterium]MCL5224182.1 PD-(D/E)XK nuclease family protein [Patescibacteria group bacterium]
MSEYYNAKRTRGLFDPQSSEPFRLSRSKIELFIKCRRCFYLDLRLGIAQPPGYPLTLNTAVDALLKKEFDAYRAKGNPHPLMKSYGIDAVPFRHEYLELWRESRRGGVEYIDPETNFRVTGGIDDVWVNSKGQLIVVDYKATAKSGEVSLDADWQNSYKRQVEVYQWLFRKNDFDVSPTAYFVYVNGKADAKAFDARLEFNVKLIPYEGDDSWIQGMLAEARKVLEKDTLPTSSEDCDYCAYWGARSKEESC